MDLEVVLVGLGVLVVLGDDVLHALVELDRLVVLRFGIIKLRCTLSHNIISYTYRMHFTVQYRETLVLCGTVQCINLLYSTTTLP